ncbi:MAG: hypothetical protein MZV49_13155 [Rhodopseudomonas palustris]|nr:hypothetical protein [Rhodopseudomonas palustris]
MRADADERFAQDVVQRAQGRDPSDEARARNSTPLTAGASSSWRRPSRTTNLKQLSAIRLESLEQPLEVLRRRAR